MKIEEIELVETCGMCPEQYDAFVGGNRVGYLRLRHGHFRVDCPDCGDKTVLSTEPYGDGCFEDSERDVYLLQAKRSIIDYWNSL